MYDSFPVCRSIFNHWIFENPDYLKIWVYILGRTRYKKEDKKGLYLGISYTISYGDFIYGRPTWSKELNITEAKIRTCMSKLVKDDMIVKQNQYSKFTIYKVINYEKYNQQDNQLIVLENQHIMDISNQQNNQEITNRQPTDNQQTTNNKEGKESTKNINKGKKVIYSENPILNEALEELMEIRKKLKCPNSERAVKLLLNELDKISTDDGTKLKIINQSILNGWKGVFPLKQEGFKREDKLATRKYKEFKEV